MVRYLVVANQTVAEAPLAEAIAVRLRAGECEFFIVVPANAPARAAHLDGRGCPLDRQASAG
jgi:hypothetical protein